MSDIKYIIADFRCDKCKSETEELYQYWQHSDWLCLECHEKKLKKLEKEEKKNETK